MFLSSEEGSRFAFVFDRLYSSVSHVRSFTFYVV